MRAVQVAAPGAPLRLVETTTPEPGHGEVLIRVEACGVCHSDVVAKEGYLPGIPYPITPGHEVVGRIAALGTGVEGWEIGRRVGVGWYAGYCHRCEACRRGQFTRCARSGVTGVTRHGGYAEAMVATAEALVAIPDEFAAAEAAPLLCAGVSTFMGLVRCGVRPGRLIAIQGVGGLGHLAIQFAVRMGYRVVAIDRGAERGALALQLGAHAYIDALAEDAAAALARAGGAAAVLAVHDNAAAMGEIAAGLADDGVLMVLGVPEEPVAAAPRRLLNGQKVAGAAGGSPVETEDAIAFCALTGVRPMIETIALEDLPAAFERMLQGKARFRYVVVFGS